MDHLDIGRGLAKSTQCQALNALVFAFRAGFGCEPGDLPKYRSSERAPKAPVVLSKDEAMRLLHCVRPGASLLVKLLYGSGLRLGEALDLRVTDLDFDHGVLVVRDGKGGKDRRSTLPRNLVGDLREQLVRTRLLFDEDLGKGVAGVYLPGSPGSAKGRFSKDWVWQYVFPSRNFQRDPGDGVWRRRHLNERFVQRAVKDAARLAGIHKDVTPHTLRHSFGTHLLMARYDIRTVQELMGHASVRTTMVYLHAMNRPELTVRSPLDEGLDLREREAGGDAAF